MFRRYDVDVIARCLPHVFDSDHAWGYRIIEGHRDPAMPPAELDPAMYGTIYAVAADIQLAFKHATTPAESASIYFRVIGDMTWAEAARRRGLSKRTVRDQVESGLQRMSDYLEGVDRNAYYDDED